ncbi:MAG: ERF family protein [Betaproteobacteria bacterium]|nr:ERF family protein [Betaproteobacteria bacterium]
MKTSQSITKIAPALVVALAKIEDVTKSETAQVATKSGGKYNYSYATLPDTLQIARPVLAEQKLALMQGARIADTGSAVEIETQIIHESGEWIGETLAMPLPNGATPQEIGSAITYGRRYGAQALLGMASEDDDGEKATAAQRERGASTRQPPPEAKPATKPTAEQETKTADWCASIEEAGDEDTLVHRYKRAYSEIHAFGLPMLTNLVVAAKDARKKALGITEKAAA